MGLLSAVVAAQMGHGGPHSSSPLPNMVIDSRSCVSVHLDGGRGGRGHRGEPADRLT